MAELVSYLSIEPHMRSFGGFPTLPDSAPLTRGLFLSVTPNPRDTPIVVGVCPICDSDARIFSSNHAQPHQRLLRPRPAPRGGRAPDPVGKTKKKKPKETRDLLSLSLILFVG